VAPLEAGRRAAVQGRVGRVTIVALLGRPAYRFINGGTSTVFADTGEVLQPVDAADSVRVAASLIDIPHERVHYLRTLAGPDQWTIGLSSQLPLHHIAIDDARGTEAYVSARTGEVALTTDRRTRAIGWVSAIPHWFYVTAIRTRERVWRQLVLWTSALGAIAACAGLLVGAVQYRARYAGVRRWHYRAGVLFGPLALTWVVSGWLSMQPWQWASRSRLYPRIVDALSGGGVDLSVFPAFDGDKWESTIEGDVKEIDLVRVFGEPHYLIRRTDAAPLVVSTRTLKPRAAFDAATIAERLRTAMPDLPIATSSTVSDYDAYYYDRARRLPLPVARFEFADPERTIAYIDLATSALAADFTRRQRIERWAYHGLHSLDFPFFYTVPLLRSVVTIVLCAGGLTLSLLGATMALNRLRRSR